MLYFRRVKRIYGVLTAAAVEGLLLPWVDIVKIEMLYEFTYELLLEVDIVALCN